MYLSIPKYYTTLYVVVYYVGIVTLLANYYSQQYKLHQVLVTQFYIIDIIQLHLYTCIRSTIM